MKATKKLFLIIAMFTLGVTAMSARDNLIVEGSFAKIQGAKRMNLNIDWSYLHIDGHTPREWIDVRNNEQPQYDAERELEKELKVRWLDLVTTSNEKLNKKQFFLLPYSTEEDYTLTITPHQVDRRGNLEAFCTITNGDDEVVVKFVLTGKGGVFGTMGNLWGDGFKSAGKNLAKIIEKFLLK